MSTAALEWAFAASIRGADKAVLLALAHHHDAETGECRPTGAALEAASGLSGKTVRAALDSLARAGLVTADRARGREYRFALHIGAAPKTGDAPEVAKPVKRETLPFKTGDGPVLDRGLKREMVPFKTGDAPVLPRARAYKEDSFFLSLKEVRKKERKIYPSSDENSAAFEAFWSAYPRKVGKGQARRAFAAALKKIPATEILAGLDRARFSDDVNYIPHASTWLNGERWADAPDATTPPRQFRNGFLELVRREGIGVRAAEPENQFLRLVQNGK
jgi:hypothetical protein